MEKLSRMPPDSVVCTSECADGIGSESCDSKISCYNARNENGRWILTPALAEQLDCAAGDGGGADLGTGTAGRRRGPGHRYGGGADLGTGTAGDGGGADLGAGTETAAAPTWAQVRRGADLGTGTAEEAGTLTWRQVRRGELTWGWGAGR